MHGHLQKWYVNEELKSDTTSESTLVDVKANTENLFVAYEDNTAVSCLKNAISQHQSFIFELCITQVN